MSVEGIEIKLKLSDQYKNSTPRWPCRINEWELYHKLPNPGRKSEWVERKGEDWVRYNWGSESDFQKRGEANE